MPELPEVETIVGDLRPRLVGRTIEGVDVIWEGTIGAPPVAEFTRRVVGLRVEGVERRGKYILIHLSDGDLLLAHLRMSGRLVVAEQGAVELRFQRLALRMSGGVELRFSDLRKFGRMHLVPASELAELDERLGPEPLSDELTPETFHEMLSRRRSRIKPLLLDQSFLAGIGNIYADEALFVARLHPNRLAATLTEVESGRLYHGLREVLRGSIANRGTTFSDYRDGRGEPGLHQVQLAVYRRTGQPCPRCGTPIERQRFGGRGTHYCPECQQPG